eukprot:scaffold377524_cov18-Prasinocladus_malaysianus.AAC.1
MAISASLVKQKVHRIPVDCTTVRPISGLGSLQQLLSRATLVATHSRYLAARRKKEEEEGIATMQARATMYPYRILVCSADIA